MKHYELKLPRVGMTGVTYYNGKICNETQFTITEVGKNWIKIKYSEVCWGYFSKHPVDKKYYWTGTIPRKLPCTHNEYFMCDRPQGLKLSELMKDV